MVALLAAYNGIELPGFCAAQNNVQTSQSTNPSISQHEPQANSEEIPKQILKSGVKLDSKVISPNSRQLAEEIGLTPVLEKIQSIHDKYGGSGSISTEDNLELHMAQMDAITILQETNYAIDFVMAELQAEYNLYVSMLGTFSDDRDKAVLKTNALSFVTNGLLWAVAEAYDIPTFRYPRLSIPSGTNGILAGVVPSIASAYALYQLNGKKKTSEEEPNMLAKLFDYPTNPEIEYPKAVWRFLNTVPPDDPSGKTRRDQLIDRWIKDKNISSFTDRTSRKDLDIITASVPRKHGLSIATLNTRQTMLEQLSAEILKMKRLLFDLSMAVRGEKTL
jgi:hypothetical protein